MNRSSSLYLPIASLVLQIVVLIPFFIPAHFQGPLVSLAPTTSWIVSLSLSLASFGSLFFQKRKGTAAHRLALPLTALAFAICAAEFLWLAWAIFQIARNDF